MVQSIENFDWTIILLFIKQKINKISSQNWWKHQQMIHSLPAFGTIAPSWAYIEDEHWKKDDNNFYEIADKRFGDMNYSSSNLKLIKSLTTSSHNTEKNT